jgi:transketolase
LELAAKLDQLPYRTFVLLGDSEMAEGSVWEAMACAAHYKLNNLVAILDVNRLGQRGETMLGHHTEVYQKRAEAFGWETITIDGHDMEEIINAFIWACGESKDGKFQNPKPKIIIAKTLKGKGVSFIEDKDGWHGKALSRDELGKALVELGNIDKNLVGKVELPEKVQISNDKLPISNEIPITQYPNDKPVATRKAYGNALANLAEANSNVVVLDAETSNSTYAEFVKKNHPERFFEMYIAEQNMVGAALGFARRGKIPFVSTFAAFFARAFDQIRMSQYAKSNIKFVGSHAGVSIGEDGASQMGLEELAMFRTLLDSVVLYPSDAVSTECLVQEAAKHFGNVYIQTTRKETAIIYKAPHPNPPLEGEGTKKIDSSPLRGEGKEGVEHEFKIGGSCVLKSSDKDVTTVVGAGITVHEALAAYEELKKEGINIRVIDLYSIKPIDTATLEKAARETKNIITVEDSYPEGGIGEAVAQVLSAKCQVISLAVRKMPRSGKPEELLAYEEIDKNAIMKVVKQLALLNTD